MPKLLFTDTNIASFVPTAPKTEAWFWDTQEAGLGLRVRVADAETTRTWILGYSIGGKDRRDRFGKFSEFTLAEARNHVHQARRNLAEKVIDPRVVKQQQEAEAASITTLAEAIEAFFARGIGSNGKPWRGKTRTAHERYLIGTQESEPYFKPLLARPIKHITREQIAGQLDRITRENSKFVAKQARTSLREVYRLAWGKGWVPNLDVINGTIDPAPKGGFVPRDRVLTEAELVEVWKAGDALIKLLILTGCRREEIGGMCWSEIKGNVLTLPAGRTKTNVERDIPLSPAAVAILAGIERKGERVFGSLCWSRIKDKLPKFAKHWTLHDLRRTMRTGLSEIGVFPHVAELCIGHKREKIVGTYDLARQWQEQAAAFNRWAAHVEALVSERPTADIISLRVA